ncbi:malonyl-coenzyme A:anthocyanin 3-O-glucoside-6''-O-malonyltransferase-like [Tasmannia lanceolata]|uniref:malonyl-coenzyme A:anthocyanin 3-O-glucoside-6''-O-malonyltransferase-like n=1 Tax=Tasmannia lanceolata TaxID=3420 RepID=UPI0040634167
MAPTHTMQVLEQIRVSPPPGSVKDNSILLTFFDVFMAQIHPVQLLFFYQYPHSTTHFLHTHFPNLKHSLSLSLQLFYPLAGHLTRSPETGDHVIRYINGDSVALTIAESDADFERLTTNLARPVKEFHHLVPPLSTSDTEKMPILAVQVTLFSNSGICIGISIHHGATDGRSLTHFMKSWASICRAEGDLSVITSPPFVDRTMVASLDQIKRKFFIEMEKVNVNNSDVVKKTKDADMVKDTFVLGRADLERHKATFVLGRADLERLRQWVLARVDPSWKPSHYSSFVITCAYVWICLVKVRKIDGDKRVNITFPMDCRACLDPPLPSTYFGNCIATCFAEEKASDLGGENALVLASEAIRRAIRGMEDGVLKGAELWNQKFLSFLGELVLIVGSSPRFRMYDIDFGWGRVKKVEIISIAGSDLLSLAESRDEEGGVEVGLALHEHEILHFSSLFEEGLKMGKLLEKYKVYAKL